VREPECPRNATRADAPCKADIRRVDDCPNDDMMDVASRSAAVRTIGSHDVRQYRHVEIDQ